MKKIITSIMLALLPLVSNAYDAKINGIYYNFSGNEAIVTSGYPTYSGAVVIPSSVTYNGKTYSVVSISEFAFLGCTDLTSVTIPNSVTSIGGYAFCNCSSLTSVTIPNSVTSIGYEAFHDCSGLTSVTIPESVTSIGYAAFRECSSLTSIKVETGNTKYDSRNNCNAIIETATSTLIAGCQNTVIPNSVTSIGYAAFIGCSGLTSVTIPKSVTSIGSYAFQGCSSLTDFWCYAESVPSTESNAFNKSSIASATLHVPANSLNQYKSASPWSGFGNIQPIQEYTLTYMVDGEVFKTYEVGYGSVITPEPTPTKEGYTFSGWYGLPTTMPAHDVVVTGFYIANNYTLTYMVDGEAYKIYTIACGTKITPEPAPIKEGYSFSGWSYIPSTMPAHDVTVQGSFTINSYTLTYLVDGEEYKTETLVYGTEITPEAEPSKEGYTFSGWSEIPETMPAQDVTVTGSFTVNSYTLSYIVDGEVYKTFKVEYGSTITPEAEPMRAGYTFSGWSEIPETMPANDVEVTGNFILKMAESIALDNESLLFNSTDAQQLIVTLTPSDLINNTISWSSTDTEVATVDEAGLVTPVGNGEAYIIACTTDGTELKDSCMVTVDFKAATLAIDKESVKFTKLKRKKLTAIVTPDKASQEVTWSSSDASIVTVSETGTITPLRNGKAIITATTTDGTELSATCTVTVSIPSQFEVAVTQTTFTIQSNSETSEAMNIKAIIDGEEYDLGDEGKLTGLAPGRTYHVEVNADIDGYNWTEELDVTMAEIAVNFDCKASPTTLDISAVYDAGDATVTSASFEGEENVSSLNLIGLEPAQTYSFTYSINTEEGGTYTYETQFTTETLALNISRTKVVSVGNVVVVASSNIVEEENVSVGFEWRRYDWPDEIQTKTGAAYIYAGTIEGSIKNLNADKFWKIRPYFLSQAGNRFLGDWVTIDPSDVSYFEPSVHTYNSISVEGNTAEVKGFVMQGSDDVESQGFMYWMASPQSSSRRNANGVPVDAKIVKANGNMMVASLEDLEFETNYCYVAFAKTSEGETFYGEQQTFTTGEMDPDNINEIKNEKIKMNNDSSWFTIDGRKLDKPQKGINIIRYADGTTKKVLIK